MVYWEDTHSNKLGVSNINCWEITVQLHKNWWLVYSVQYQIKYNQTKQQKNCSRMN